MKSILRTYTILIISLVAAISSAATVEKRTFQVINASHGLADNSAQVVVCTRTGRMIIATLGNLNFYDGNTFSNVNTHDAYNYQLPQYKGNYHLYFDTNHHIWLKDTHKVTCVDLLQEQFIVNVDSVIKDMGCKDVVQDLFVDSVGGVWLLTEQGLYGVNNKKTYNVLHDRNLQDMDVFDNLLLTFYDDGEEVAQDLETGAVVHRSKPYDWEKSQKYSSSSVIYRYKDGYYQVRNGDKESVLMHFDVKKCEWTIVHEFPYHVNNIAQRMDRLFLPSEWGFWIYRIKSQELEWVKELTLNNGSTIETDCNMIAFDRQGGTWIGTEKRGLLYARPTRPVFHVYPWTEPLALKYGSMMDGIEQNITEFQGQRANCMYLDSRGWTWIGTNNGLYLYKSPHSEPLIFSKKNGFNNNVIHSVIEDKNHHIWAATSNGISCVYFNGEEVSFVNSFNERDGVPSESFINCKSMLLDDSLIVMQGLDHVVEFNPSDLDSLNTPHPYKLFPKLVHLLVNGNYVEPGMVIGDNMIINRAISRTYEISLNSNQTTVSLTFSALNYYRPLQTFYRVRVKGLPLYEEWQEFSYYNTDGKVDGKGMLHLPLLGLEPGDYEVEVQASMYPGQWEGTPFSWIVHVNQPWWRTTGLIWLMVMLIVALGLVNVFFYVRNERLRLQRTHEEGDIIRKIRQFVERSDAYKNELLSPSQDDLQTIGGNADQKLSPEFIELMLRLMPYVRTHMTGELTMSQLSAEAKMDVVSLFEMMMAEIYKSPRELVRISRLQHAAGLLKTTDMEIKDIAAECKFYTPNYLMGCFFHQYKLTPAEFREMNR